MRLGESKQTSQIQGQVKRLQCHPSLTLCPLVSHSSQTRGHSQVALHGASDPSLTGSDIIRTGNKNVSDLWHYLLPTWGPGTLLVFYNISLTLSNPRFPFLFLGLSDLFLLYKTMFFIFNQMHCIISEYLPSLGRRWIIFGDLVFNVHPYNLFLLQKHRTVWCYKGQDHLFNKVNLIPLTPVFAG